MAQSANHYCALQEHTIKFIFALVLQVRKGERGPTLAKYCSVSAISGDNPRTTMDYMVLSITIHNNCADSKTLHYW